LTYARIDRVFGRSAQNLVGRMSEPGMEGALAALESFYYSFNTGDIEVLREVWVSHDLIRLKNPLGGILEGIQPVTELYDGIFNGSADVWVEFHDIVAYDFGDAVVFSGRERGEFTTAVATVPLGIRTTRVFHWVDGRWGQVHHHGSVADTDLLATYRSAVND